MELVLFTMQLQLLDCQFTYKLVEVYKLYFKTNASITVHFEHAVIHNYSILQTSTSYDFTAKNYYTIMIT